VFERKSCIVGKLLRTPLSLRSLQYSYYLVLKGEARGVAEATRCTRWTLQGLGGLSSAQGHSGAACAPHDASGFQHLRSAPRWA